MIRRRHPNAFGAALVWVSSLSMAFSTVTGVAASPSGGRSPAVRWSGRLPLQAAAPFMLTDADGNKCSLADYRGTPVALFFFCGCAWCTRCARDWGQFQRGGVLTNNTSLHSGSGPRSARPVTLVVFSGDAAAARDFALSSGLDSGQTVLLPDTAMHVTLDLYHAEPCPRVFVLDPKGRVRYTNDHKDDAARKASEMVIASRALDALRASLSGTVRRGLDESR